MVGVFEGWRGSRDPDGFPSVEAREKATRVDLMLRPSRFTRYVDRVSNR
jgi:hypothetical protein